MPAPRPLEFRRRAVELARPQNKPIARTARNLGSPASCLHNWMARARRRRGLVRELAALVMEMTRPAIAVSVIRAAATGLPASGTKVIQRVLPAGQEGTAADRHFCLAQGSGVGNSAATGPLGAGSSRAAGDEPGVVR